MAIFTASLLTDVGLVLIGLISAVYFLFQWSYGHWRRKGVPYIKPEPIFGNFRPVMLSQKSMGEQLMALYFEGKGEPYIGYFAMHRPILLIRDLDLVKRILVKDFNFFTDRSFSPNEKKDPLFASNIFGRNGSRWRYLRNKLSPTFTSGKMKSMYRFLEECQKQMMEYIDKEIQNGEAVLEIKEIAARFTTDVVASVGFGLQSNSLKNPDSEFRYYLRKVVEFDLVRNIKVTLGFMAPKVLSTLNLQIWDSSITTFLRRVVWDTVKHREQTGEKRGDFLDLLMQLRRSGKLDDDGAADESAADRSVLPSDVPVAGEEAVKETANGHANEQAKGQAKGQAKEIAKGTVPDDKYPLDGDEFVAQAFVFLAAGFETSSSTLTFALYELARQPHIQTRLRDEVQEALRDNGGTITYESLHGMTYLHQVVTETLRLYPILPFLDRVAVQDYVIPGTNVHLAKGDTVVISAMAIQRDPKYFPDPETFDPERWSEENKKNIVPYTFLAFGEGPRICIGMRMGLMQAKLALAHIINKFEVKPCASTPIPLKLDPQNLLLSTKDGMKLTVSRVSNVTS